MDLEKAAADFADNGYAVIENFLTEADVECLRTKMHQIVENMNPDEHPKSVFTTGEDQNRDNYFLESVDKIRFFYEEGAFDKDNKLVVDKQLALNKVGHALHFLDADFRRVSFSSQVQSLVKGFGFKDPAIVQSMYIFKQPHIGGAVGPHYDGTYLRLEPMENLMGIWFALDDATEENGCMWFIPGSHKDEREVYHYARTQIESDKLLEHRGQKPDFDPTAFVPVPVAKGSCVVIHGLVWHKSELNTSGKPRHAYACHISETRNTTWNPDNWLQETETYKFPRIFSTSTG